MEGLDFATVFKEVAKIADLQNIVKTYKNKIDHRAFNAVTRASFEAVVEKKPVEEINARCMEIMKDYIVPRGKMTLPEYMSLLESVGNVFLKYVKEKSKHAGIDQSNKSNQISPSADYEQPKDNKKETEQDWFLLSTAPLKRVGLEEKIWGAYWLNHNCPFCRKRASTLRSLPIIMSTCFKDAKAQFSCESCGRPLIFPLEVFQKELIENLAKKDHRGEIYVDASDLSEKTPNDVFVPNWFEVFSSVNLKISSENRTKQKPKKISSENRTKQKPKKWWQLWK